MEPAPAPVMESPPSQTVIVTEVRPTTALPMDDEVSCRKPQRLPGSRLLGPAVCLSAGAWAELVEQGKDISPDGRN